MTDDRVKEIMAEVRHYERVGWMLVAASTMKDEGVRRAMDRWLVWCELAFADRVEDTRPPHISPFQRKHLPNGLARMVDHLDLTTRRRLVWAHDATFLCQAENDEAMCLRDAVLASAASADTAFVPPMLEEGLL